MINMSNRRLITVAINSVNPRQWLTDTVFSNKSFIRLFDSKKNCIVLLKKTPKDMLNRIRSFSGLTTKKKNAIGEYIEYVPDGQEEFMFASRDFNGNLFVNKKEYIMNFDGRLDIDFIDEME